MSSLHNDLDTWAGNARVSGQDRIEIDNGTAHHIAQQLREHQWMKEALENIRDGYGPNHLSRFARNIARAALSKAGA